jgi:hypothetical protein
MVLKARTDTVGGIGKAATDSMGTEVSRVFTDPSHLKRYTGLGE